MKKTYIKPEMEVTNLELVTMIATSAPKIEIEDGSGEEILSNGRRGTWGNLWNNN